MLVHDQVDVVHASLLLELRHVDAIAGDGFGTEEVQDGAEYPTDQGGVLVGLVAEEVDLQYGREGAVDAVRYGRPLGNTTARLRPSTCCLWQRHYQSSVL